MTRDPLVGSSRRPDTLNRYSYVRNNPANLVDPYGLFGFSDITDTVSGATDAVSDVVETVGKTAVAVAENPLVQQCVIWGVSGAVATGGSGAVAGCAAGVISHLVEEYVPSNPFTPCLTWGAGAFFGSAGLATNPRRVAAGFGCAAGILSWADSEFGPSNEFSACGAWAAPGGAGAWLTGTSLVRTVAITVAACAAGTTSSLLSGDGYESR